MFVVCSYFYFSSNVSGGSEVASELREEEREQQRRWNRRGEGEKGA
jgi:hypothetical protein